jgi:hypothetical protein
MRTASFLTELLLLDCGAPAAPVGSRTRASDTYHNCPRLSWLAGCAA